MSDENPNDNQPPQPGGKRKRRGRSRRRRNKSGKPTQNQAAPEASAPEQPKAEAAPTADRGRSAPPPRSDKPAPSRPPRNDKPGPQNTSNDAGPKGKKRRKPRTKQCVHCMTPCTTIHRVRLDHRKQWVFICDICWPTRCVDNPHYEFGGTWVTGRIVKPESQILEERRQRHHH